MAENQLPLRDLHLPDPVGMWPLAPGWWLVLAVAAGVAVWLLSIAWRRHRVNAPRRYALRELAAIESSYRRHQDAVLFGKEISELLRRGMLAYAPREEVAGLTGEAWLAWLDRDMALPYFHTEGGKSLLQLPYRDPKGDTSDIDINALLAAVRMRLATPVGGLR